MIQNLILALISATEKASVDNGEALSNMQVDNLVSDLAFILLLGAIVTVLFKCIRQPVVLGYIVAGFLASPHFQYLPSVTTESNIEFWAQLGIVVLLFSLGLEFSFKKLLNVGGSAIVTALIIVIGMMATGFIVGHFLNFSHINSLFLGGMLSMSSTTIIIKAFTDLNLRQKKFASLVFAVLIVEDLFAVLMMVILSSIAITKSVGGPRSRTAWASSDSSSSSGSSSAHTSCRRSSMPSANTSTTRLCSSCLSDFVSAWRYFPYIADSHLLWERS